MSFALHDLDKEGKGAFGLAYHSEKLAVAFGLLAEPSGAPIRITKNLRVCVCGDCHNAMKYISRVYLRHIILTNSNCFHFFRDVNCYCGETISKHFAYKKKRKNSENSAFSVCNNGVYKVTNLTNHTLLELLVQGGCRGQ